MSEHTPGPFETPDPIKRGTGWVVHEIKTRRAEIERLETINAELLAACEDARDAVGVPVYIVQRLTDAIRKATEGEA